MRNQTVILGDMISSFKVSTRHMQGCRSTLGCQKPNLICRLGNSNLKSWSWWIIRTRQVYHWISGIVSDGFVWPWLTWLYPPPQCHLLPRSWSVCWWYSEVKLWDGSTNLKEVAFVFVDTSHYKLFGGDRNFYGKCSNEMTKSLSQPWVEF